MTLFEVSISLVIVAFGVISVLMVFPTGLKAQQLARFQVYASAKALEMIDTYSTTSMANPGMDVEAEHAWDVSASRCNTAFDLEHRLSSYRHGLIPMPMEIARRLDSDGDEIQQVLDEGGYVYFSQPQASTGISDTLMQTNPPNDAQKLVFAVTGYAQSNAVPILPQKAWPYYMPFPSPPSHGVIDRVSGFNWGPINKTEEPPSGGKSGYPKFLWENSFDPDMRPVFWCKPRGSKLEYGYADHYTEPSKGTTPTKDSAVRYIQTALWYCKKKGIDSRFYDGSALTALTALTDWPSTSLPPSLPEVDRWKLVQSLRFLSHATTCLSAFVTHAELVAGVPINAGFSPDATAHPTSDAYTVTLDKIQYLHASTMNLTSLFAACYPYDWAVPRPLHRAIMMDHPLFEYDLFSPPASGSLYGTSGITGQQWKPISAQPIRHIGRSFEFSNIDVLGTPPGFVPVAGNPDMPNNTHWGNHDHFTLTKPFSPDERCRQLIFWVVDWQAYEDAETAPSAPLDAGRYPRGAPKAGKNLIDLLSNTSFHDTANSAFRNPEKPLAFIEPMAAKASGHDVHDLIIGLIASGTSAHGNDIGNGNPKYDQFNQGPYSKEAFLGYFGADRNFNLKLDRGPVPTSVRMRASTVARFNFYDLRIPALLR